MITITIHQGINKDNQYDIYDAEQITHMSDSYENRADVFSKFTGVENTFEVESVIALQMFLAGDSDKFEYTDKDGKDYVFRAINLNDVVKAPIAEEYDWNTEVIV